MISDMLDDDAAREPAMGRDNPLNLPFPAAAKTGTTNDFRDNWTMGYTPGLVVGVWAGNTDNSEMINVSGLTGAAPLWSDFMDTVYATPDMVATLGNNGAQPPTEFVPPAGLEQRRLCALSSVTGWANECQWQGSEWFLQADPNAPIPTATPPVPLEQRQVVWEKLEPGVWRMPAFYVTPDLQITSTENPDLPTQQFCYFLQGQRMVDLPQNTFQQLFLQPPRNPESIQPAYQWASARNMMILPPTPCQQSALVAITPTPNLDVWQPTATPNWQATASANNNGGQVPATPVPNNVPFRITNPQPNQKVSGLVQIYGTANFNTAEVQYYKIEIDLGQNQWVTLGETHSQPVVNGVLESLHADALNAGIYKIRLIGVRWDGNYVTQPFTIPIEIVRN
jgi:membrane peptidoglycan carboxypeptidase